MSAFNFRRAAGTLLVVAGVTAAGCSSGGSTPPTGGNGPAQVQFSIVVPAAPSVSTSARRPNFTAPSGTQSVSILLTAANGSPQSGNATVVNTTASTTGCSSSSGSLTCSATVDGVSGSDTFTVTSYSQPNAQGSVVAEGTVQVQAQAGQTVTAPVTLSGTIATVAISFPISEPQGAPVNVPVNVIAKDSSGNTIMGTYTTPITLADSDTSGATKLSVTSIPDSTTAAKVTLAYTGAQMKNGATISAAVNGLASSAITNATFTPNGDYRMVNGDTYTYQFNYSSAQVLPTPGTPFTSSGTYTNTVATGASFNGKTNLMAVTESLPYTGPTPMPTGYQSQATTYYAWQQSAGISQLAIVGYTSTYNDGSGDVFSGTQTWSQPYVAFEIPFAAKNTWNPIGVWKYTSTGSSSGSTNTSSETWNGDGSYTYDWSSTGSYVGQSHEQVNADGSASSTDIQGNGTYTTVVGTPEPAPSGGTGEVIPVTTNFVASPAPSPVPTPTTTLVPDWYPNNGVPKPLNTETITDEGSVTIPASCNVSSSIATSAEQFEDDSTNLDTLMFSVAQYKNTYYVAPNVGVVCIVFTGTYTNYDGSNTGTMQSQSQSTETDSLTTAALQAAMRKTSFANAASTASLALTAHAQLQRMQYLHAQHERAVKLRIARLHRLLHR